MEGEKAKVKRLFEYSKIDRAIVMTQFDMRGFAHPLGVRFQSDKNSWYILINFISICRSAYDEMYPVVMPDLDTSKCSYEELLNLCRKLAGDCDCSEHEAIQLIINDIVTDSDKRKQEVAEGIRKPSSYIAPLAKDNVWGKIVLALAEAFNVKITGKEGKHNIKINFKNPPNN